MSRLQTVPNLAVNDNIPETWVDAVALAQNYLVGAGGDLASAATLSVSSHFHRVTGTTTIDNFTDPLGAVAGQAVTLLFTGALIVRNDGGGSGNIRTPGEADRAVAAGEALTFIYDGTNWQLIEPRKAIRGVVASNGSITSGAGFSVSKGGTGIYTITFAVPFAAAPVVVATPQISTIARQVNITALSTSAVTLKTFDGGGSGVGDATDSAFHFIAMPL